VAQAHPNGWRTFGIVIITILLTLGVGYWAISTILFPSKFIPVQLNEKEQLQLDKKLQHITSHGTVQPNHNALKPEPYSESDARREINFSERELNALLAKNTGLANRLAIHLSDNLASAKLLITLDPDFPILGGETIKVTTGVEAGEFGGSPRVILKGMSVWGIPMPNAWLGNIKNINLVEEFGNSGGFWQAVKDGIEDIEIKQGTLRIKLKE